VIIGKILSWITGDLVGQFMEIYKLHKQGKISEAEFESRIKISAQETAAKVEASWAEASASIARATQSTLKSSPILQRAWAVTIFFQLLVLVWYQLGASAFLVITGTPWPSPGATVEWAYLLLGAMLGAGPLVFRR
jgi:hypothetical protein